jgi:hypothetical protein
MKRIRDLVGHELDWVTPSALNRAFELRDGNEIVSTLRFRSLFGSFATAETADGSWTFKRVGFFQTRVTVCAAGSETEIASFRNSTWTAGGTLTLASGHSFRANTNFWMSKYEFQDEAEHPLVRFRKLGGLFHLSAKMEVTPAAAGLDALPWLVVLGWYLVVKMRDDCSAAGGAAAAAAGG